MRRVLFVLIIFAIAITACAPAAAATEGPTIEEATPTHIPVDLTPAQRAALRLF
jgi:hypothetical protein